jgi:hypothetical protein
VYGMCLYVCRGLSDFDVAFCVIKTKRGHFLRMGAYLMFIKLGHTHTLPGSIPPGMSVRHPHRHASQTATGTRILNFSEFYTHVAYG